MEFVYLIFGLLIGSVITYLFLKNKFTSQSGTFQERNRIYEENNKKLEAELN